MKSARIIPLIGLLFIAAALPGSAADLPGGVEIRNYNGWEQSIYLNALNKPVQVVIIPAVGGRAANFSFAEENILYENSAVQGQIANAAEQDLSPGGYQCDVGPPGRNLPPHFQLLQGRASFETKSDYAARVINIPDPDLGVVIEKNFLLAPDTGELGVVQHLRNISNKTLSYCVWDRTECKPGGFVFFPLNKKSRFRAGWSQRRKSHRDFYEAEHIFYDGQNPNVPQARVLDGVLVLEASGDAAQIGADSAAGWIAYARGRLLYVKYFPYFPGGNYSDGGNTVEINFDPRAVELSPLSPEIKLAPGQDYTFPEKWQLVPLRKEVTTWEEARKLVRKIRPSPFGQ